MCETELYWHGCYKGTFDLINPESFAHPAKMAPGLCFKILSHLEELNLLKAGDVILDPMAGTGLTAITAGAKGYPSITVELEEKFINLEKQNKEYAERKLYKELDWQIIQGDSRRLSELLKGNGHVAVTSPPYETLDPAQTHMTTKDRVNPNHPHYRPPWVTKFAEGYGESRRDYGTTPGQIGNLKDVPLKAITSPPYANRVDDHGVDQAGYEGFTDKLGDYGRSSGQTGALPDKPLKSVMSPPYDAQGHPSIGSVNKDSWGKEGTDIVKRRGLDGTCEINGESYLPAMSQVYAEIAKVSDVLVVVIKNPTRNKQLRRLDLDTIRILKETGWTIHCQHRALLFEEQEHPTLFGEVQKKIKGRMSFFKRLSWQNGQPVASWEDVLICKRLDGH